MLYVTPVTIIIIVYKNNEFFHKYNLLMTSSTLNTNKSLLILNDFILSIMFGLSQS